MEPISLIFDHKLSLFTPYRFAQARILVVDDAPFNLKLVSAKLSAAGYRAIETAYDGVNAVEKTLSFKPDIVLLDLMMPNMDGFGYCERVRNDKTIPRMPIIVQTALGDRDIKLRALSCGADDFISKPLDLEEMSLRVRVHLERYFMLQDLEHMRTYLKMELDVAKNMIERMQQYGFQPPTHHILKRHIEVLQLMAEPPVKPKKLSSSAS